MSTVLASDLVLVSGSSHGAKALWIKTLVHELDDLVTMSSILGLGSIVIKTGQEIGAGVYPPFLINIFFFFLATFILRYKLNQSTTVYIIKRWKIFCRF